MLHVSALLSCVSAPRPMLGLVLALVGIDMFPGTSGLGRVSFDGISRLSFDGLGRVSFDGLERVSFDGWQLQSQDGPCHDLLQGTCSKVTSTLSHCRSLI